jgi:hypothetical protein
MKKILPIIMLGLFVGLAAGCQKASESDPAIVDASDFLSPHPVISSMPIEDLSDDEVADLLYMREEEKLARDVYLTLYDKWGQQIFSNIAGSEQTHTDSVRYLIERYNLEDPVKDETVGVFTNQDLQKLYDDLVADGSESLEDALFVGATIEDLDIFDLQDAMLTTDNLDIREVYENLMRGSRNHMRAFSRQLVKNGDPYIAQYLTKEEVDAIINSDQERGNGMQPGRGGGNGGGGGNGKNR